MTPPSPLRWLVPRGLLGRALLIILVPLVIVQIIALYLFYGSHLDVISRRLAGAVAGDVSMVVVGPPFRPLARHPIHRRFDRVAVHTVR